MRNRLLALIGLCALTAGCAEQAATPTVHRVADTCSDLYQDPALQLLADRVILPGQPHQHDRVKLRNMVRPDIIERGAVRRWEEIERECARRLPEATPLEEDRRIRQSRLRHQLYTGRLSFGEFNLAYTQSMDDGFAPISIGTPQQKSQFFSRQMAPQVTAFIQHFQQAHAGALAFRRLVSENGLVIPARAEQTPWSCSGGRREGDQVRCF